ncbi:MAG: hypothetical protein Q7S00_05190 [bacterium]|nr:hypothetical protein [bacterium]
MSQPTQVRKLLFFFLLLPLTLSAATFYRGRVDYVRTEKAPKEVRQLKLNHPHLFDEDKLRSILSAIRFNKKILVMKDIENRRVFDDRAVEFLLPYLMQAFSQVGEKELVRFAFVNQDPKVIIQNDQLIACKMFIEGTTLHMDFMKLYAKLLGDYQRKGAENLIWDSQEIGVSLEYIPGIQPSQNNPKEVLIDMTHDFTKEPAAVEASQPEIRVQTKIIQKEAPKSVKERLKELEQVKKEELITEKEYQKKRKDLLKEL